MPAKDIMTLPLGETHEELGPIYRALRSVSHPRYLRDIRCLSPVSNGTGLFVGRTYRYIL